MRFKNLISSDSNNATGAVYKPQNNPDQFGLLSVQHNGDKYLSTSTFKLFYQGSWDNITWFDIAIFKTNDADYQDSVNNSWVRVVPLVSYVRVQFVNNEGETINATLGE